MPPAPAQPAPRARGLIVWLLVAGWVWAAAGTAAAVSLYVARLHDRDEEARWRRDVLDRQAKETREEIDRFKEKTMREIDANTERTNRLLRKAGVEAP